MRTFALCGLLVAAIGANAQTVLYDTFNENDQADLFDCCNTVLVQGGDKFGTKSTVDLPFTVSHKTKITEVDVPLSYTSGENSFEVVILGERRVKHHFKLHNVAPGGQCCIFEALVANGIPVAPGVTYTLRVRTTGQTIGGWNLNSAGYLGTYYIEESDGEHEFDNATLPAVRLVGK